MLVPSFVRARLTSAVGPDASASKPGSQGCAQMPERSGLAAPAGAACAGAGANPNPTATNAAAFTAVLSIIVASPMHLAFLIYLEQPFFVSSKPSKSRLALAPASVSS